jgi:hypothetical protein
MASSVFSTVTITGTSLRALRSCSTWRSNQEPDCTGPCAVISTAAARRSASSCSGASISPTTIASNSWQKLSSQQRRHSRRNSRGSTATSRRRSALAPSPSLRKEIPVGAVADIRAIAAGEGRMFDDAVTAALQLNSSLLTDHCGPCESVIIQISRSGGNYFTLMIIL